MSIYIALLQGINVGGKNIIKMADLKRSFESIGLCRVQTYIQSGNVLFESNEEEETLRKKIEDEIQTSFGLFVKVVIRTATELIWISQNCPFSQEEILNAEASSEVESLYVALLSQASSKEDIERLNINKSESDMLWVKGRDIYLLFHQSIRNSKLAENLQKLSIPMTTRNWKTINKLVMLAKDMTL